MKKYMIIKEGHFLDGESIYSHVRNVRLTRVSVTRPSVYRCGGDVIFYYQGEEFYIQNSGQKGSGEEDCGVIKGYRVGSLRELARCWFETRQKGTYLRAGDLYCIAVEEPNYYK